MSNLDELRQRYSTFDKIKQLVDAGESEDSYMDYKSITTKDEDVVFSKSDAEILGKALSGFANTMGGFILWGVREEGKPKKPQFQNDIFKTEEAVKKFKKLLDENTGRCAEPPPIGIEHFVLDNGDKNSYQAVVLTCIPKGNSTPLRSLKDQKFGSYIFN